MHPVMIAGVAMTPFGKFLDRSLRALVEEAAAGALRDARCEAADIQAIYFGNAAAGVISDQDMIRGQAALRHTGLAGLPIFNVENACASGSSALHLAASAVAAGQFDIVMAIGAEKLAHADKARSFAALARGVDQAEIAEAMANNAGTSSVFMDIYAAEAREYMARSGATVADFARVAEKNRNAAALNPLAQFRDGTTVEAVLASRTVSAPLTMLMCSGIGDGAAAIVVCSARKAAQLGVQPVQLRAWCVASGAPEQGLSAAPVRAAQAAYAMAGIGPGDVHVAEVHDASAPAELFVYEDIGLCGPNEGPALLRSGATAVGGRISVNASGGLLGRGHPVGATGAAQIVELVDQLRGRSGPRQRPGASVALAENAGGSLAGMPAVAAVTILSR
ncbi:thiolase family protein [Pseudorhodoferax sp.]|uniref:thiolase family protein n=1 Tax=Pseudorhodoferax sp. TaxID=1993553 RepID=UPI002DD68E41|nr:thiolase family protein [Pseudorhodoferax sp.]